MDSALLAVPVEIRLLDVGESVDRVFRLAHSIGEDHLCVERDLPWEAGRPVRVELILPDDDRPVIAKGRIAPPRRDASPDSGDHGPRPDVVILREIEADGRARVVRYLGERNLHP
jgi:hypothetical protein